jgi:hypothetical protein
MMDDERSAVLGENIFKQLVKKYVSVDFLERFAIVPGGWSNETVIRPLISSVEKVTIEPILQFP